jgi:hypothetical protein
MSYYKALINGETTSSIIRIVSTDIDSCVIKHFEMRDGGLHLCGVEIKLKKELVVLISKVYSLSPFRYFESSNWPENVYSMWSPNEPLNDSSSFLQASEIIKKSILKGMDSGKYKARVELKVREKDVLQIFGNDFEKSFVKAHFAKLYYKPTTEQIKSGRASTILCYTLKIFEEEARTILNNYKNGNTPQGILLFKNILPQVKTKYNSVSKMASVEDLVIEKFASLPFPTLTKSLSFEELKDVERKIGHFTSKTPKNHKYPTCFIDKRNAFDHSSHPLSPIFKITYIPSKAKLLIVYSFIHRS